MFSLWICHFQAWLAIIHQKRWDRVWIRTLKTKTLTPSHRATGAPRICKFDVLSAKPDKINELQEDECIRCPRERLGSCEVETLHSTGSISICSSNREKKSKEIIVPSGRCLIPHLHAPRIWSSRDKLASPTLSVPVVERRIYLPSPRLCLEDLLPCDRPRNHRSRWRASHGPELVDFSTTSPLRRWSLVLLVDNSCWPTMILSPLSQVGLLLINQKTRAVLNY